MNSVSYQVIFNEKPCFRHLEETLKESVKEYDENLEFYVQIKYCRKIDNQKYLIGFEIILGQEDAELDEDIDFNITEETDAGIFGFLDNPADFETEDELDLVLESFKSSLEDESEVIFKFSDDNLFKKLSSFYKEIFEIEMRLREILTFIFVDTYKNDFYNLLKEIRLGDNHTVISDEEKEILPQKLENEFFHMSFSTYKKMSDTIDTLNINDLIPIIDKTDTIVELRKKIENRGIIKSNYQDFLAEIEQHLNNLQDLRNCVAHNRTPTYEEIVNYTISSKKLNIAIKNFWKQCPKMITSEN